MYDNLENLTSEIQQMAENISGELIELRRFLHQNPELSWQEFKTAEFLQAKLKEEGVEVKNGFCEPALIADINGSNHGKTIAIRADMDALPMLDAKDVPYASKVEGVMHACGHDCHMAMALGVVKVLKNLSVSFPGTVRLIFQPSEESVPSGAQALTKSAALDEVDAIYAFHVAPEIDVGKIGLRPGVLTAHCNEFKLSIFGKSGHVARPHQAIDSIRIASQVLNALYDLVENRSNPSHPAVLAIGKIDGGTKANIIADRVDLHGTIRTLDDDTRDEILNGVQERVKSITHAANAKYNLQFLDPIPSVINDARLVSLAQKAAQSISANNNTIVHIEEPSMGGEDFAWYLRKVPGALIRLGTRKEGAPIHPLHSNEFDIDEKALAFGVAVMTQVVLLFLHE